MSDRPPINTWEQLVAAVKTNTIPKKHALAISYSTSFPAIGTCVWSPFFKTRPEGTAWYENGCKYFHGTRERGLEEAIAWVKETYGYDGPWVGNAMREKVPEIVQKNFKLRRAT